VNYSQDYVTHSIGIRNIVNDKFETQFLLRAEAYGCHTEEDRSNGGNLSMGCVRGPVSS